MGPRRGTAAAVSVVTAGVRSQIRARWLLQRPLRVSRGELSSALGGLDAAAVLRGRVLEAMPTVAEFERRLDADSGLAEGVLAGAERAADHRFDLLGSGPTDLGPQIDWHADFKTGRRWPLEHISRLIISYPDNSDIKVPWELSRFQHLPLLAAAFRITGERRWLEEMGSQLRDWIANNPVEFGPNWGCTMDVAIRAANWIAALAMVGEVAAGDPWFEEVLGNLLLHGRFIRGHLEWAPVRGNHYLSDIVGLLAISAVFSDGAEGRAWGRFAASELATELSHQVTPDGCDHEASIPYHRLVCELFICGLQAARVLAPDVVARAPERIQAMLGFTRDYTRLDGLAPQIGDADDGRYLPLADYGRADPRSHLHLFEQAGLPYSSPRGHAAYPDGGYWIMRADNLYIIVRCGDVGLGGLGSHAHNDALSFELAFGARPLIIDPGSYLYTADPAARNQFRSTAVHSTLQVDGAEQNPILEHALFAMEDRRRARMTRWDTSDRARPVFEGQHRGYEDLPQPTLHRRRIALDAPARSVVITDTVESAAEHRLEWTFPLGPCEASADGSRATARFTGGPTLELEAVGLKFGVEEGWLSPFYGRRIAVPYIHARKRSRPPADISKIVLSIHA